MPSFNRASIKLKGSAKECYKVLFCIFPSQVLVYTLTKFNESHFSLTNSNTKTHSSFTSLTIYSVQLIQSETGSVTQDPFTFSYSCDCSANHTYKLSNV